MGTLSIEQAPYRSEVMPEPYMLPLFWAKNTVFAMEPLSSKQAPHRSEVMPEPCMLLPQQAQKHRVFDGDPGTLASSSPEGGDA